jgi:hypothetical protein
VSDEEHPPLAFWQPYSACPCGECDVIGYKLTRWGHVAKCACYSCRNRRNRNKGRKAQTKVHRDLGGEGHSTLHEENSQAYPVWVRPEVKTGKQVPIAFSKFLATDWFRRALSQSERSLPVGSGAKAAVAIVVGGETWLVVKAGGIRHGELE